MNELNESQLSLVERVKAALAHGFDDIEQYFKDGIDTIESFIADKKAVAAQVAADPTAVDATPDVTAPPADLSLPATAAVLTPVEIVPETIAPAATPAVEVVPSGESAPVVSDTAPPTAV